MSTPIGSKIRKIREALRIGRQEFADKTGIPKNSLIGIEVGKHEPGAKALVAIAKVWPRYAAYLLTDEINIRQEDPTRMPLIDDLLDESFGGDFKKYGPKIPIEPASEKEIKDFVDDVMKQLKTVPLNLGTVKKTVETEIRKKLCEAVQEVEKKSLLKKSHGTK